MSHRKTRFRLTSVFAIDAASVRAQPTRPFSIRLSDAERRQLQREAGSQALGTYVRTRLLGGKVARSRSLSPERTGLSLILGKLGRLELATSLAELAIAAKAGAITLTPELEAELRVACRDIRGLRDALMCALGLKAEARS